EIMGFKRNAMLLNAGAAIYIGGKADSLEGGVARAAEIIDSGIALDVMQRIIDISNS
ncbi:MAG: anthranilate phosphoribosyltransferase, partial [Oscillospiraceae bacterium]|nr:anthranilate phosphoribosyltransferase [Oscillospiraceae bacterium]